MAGYSGTPLHRKLGLPTVGTVYFRNPPDGYFDALGGIPQSVMVRKRLSGAIDFAHLFAVWQKDLERWLPKARGALKKDGALWLSWPKQSSGVATDLTGNVVRRLGLDAGLVDVKVCAVDDVWSGLKFVYRLSDR